MQTVLSTNAAGARILVVEDEAIIAEEIQERLTRLNFNVVGVEDTGRKAIDAVDRTRPDLVLMDIRLKGSLDGIDTAAEIRRRCDVPIVYLTAHSDPTTLARARETAPLGYLLKPIHERELEVTVELAIFRHNMERRLRESELRYAATLASIGDAVLATDADGRITFMNAVAETLTGWRRTDAQMLPVDRVLELINESTRERVPSPIGAVLERGATVRLPSPVLLISRDGSTIPIDDSAAPILDADRNVLGVVIAFHDIRDRRLAEDALKKAEAELRHAQKMESIGQLAGGVAHDFNNVLTAINGYCDLLLGSGTLTTDSATLVHEILHASERSAQLTGQLLAFGRKQILSPAVFDLNALVKDAKALLRRLIGENIDIQTSLAADLHPIRADRVQVEQIILNLAVNARDAMPNGGRLVIETANFTLTEPTRETRPALAPGQYVRLSVLDTGEGMDAAVMARIFEPFFTTKALGKGTGLGLATVYGIVSQSGGSVYVYSEVGRGSVFKVYLPAAVTADANASYGSSAADVPGPQVQKIASAARASVRGGAAAEAARGSETVLLVEDNDAVRDVATMGLTSYGYTVLAARNAREAIELFGTHGDDVKLLVTDSVMPGLSGPQLARRLTQFRRDLPVLFLSGYDDGAITLALAEFPNARFLQKPFTSAVFAAQVREVLDARHAQT